MQKLSIRIIGPLLIGVVLLLSCGPAHKLRKAERLINEAIAQGAKVKTDTVYLTKVIPGDSTVVEVPVEKIVNWTRDTVIYQDRIKINWKVRHDTLRMQVECPPDTIRIPVTVHRSILCPDCPKDRMWKGVGMGAGGLLILLIIWGLARLIKG